MRTEASGRKWGEVIFASILGIVVTVLLVSAHQLPDWQGRAPGSGLFPQWCAAILLGLVAINLLLQVVRPAAQDGDEGPLLVPVLLVSLAIVAFALTLASVGFFFSSLAVFLIVNVLILRKRHPVVIAYGLGFAAICWLIFSVMLTVQFPR